MQLELDHIFICCSVGAPEADRLVHFGIAEGEPNTHPGQGTANRRFFFHNAFLELVWVSDSLEAQSPLVRRTGLWERWSRRGSSASPFGICCRHVPGEGNEIPFSTWEYRPPYLPAPLVIQMGTNSETVNEPLLFYVSFGRRPDQADASRQQPLEHSAGLRSITRVRICQPQREPVSPELHAVAQSCDWLRFGSASEYLMEIGFDGESCGRSADFRPVLPLVFHW